MGNEWNWKKAIPSWEFDQIQLNNYPEWERTDDGKILFVLMRIVRNISIPSSIVAELFDDVATGKFNYRVWTRSGEQTDDYPIYYAGFWFEKKADAILFQESFGGAGSWQPTYPTMINRRAKELGRT